MPLYEVEHIRALTEQQQDDLAEAITQIHADQFGAIRLFVNVRFTDVSKHRVYVAGKRRRTNRIIANVRSGPSRSPDDYNALCASLASAWGEIVGRSGDEELRMIIVLGGIVAGMEVGFVLPAAGQDKQWLGDNMAEFRKRAEEGDEDFKDVLREVETRDVFQGVVAESAKK